MKNILSSLTFPVKLLATLALLAATCLAGRAIAQDSATYDTLQGAWRFYYQNPETEQWVNKTYVMRNQIEPRVRSEARWHQGNFQYDYRIQNDRQAKLRISPVEVWSLPLTIEPTTLPALTATHDQSELRGLQISARWHARRAFEKSIVRSPAGWNGSLIIDKDTGKTSAFWNIGLRDTDSVGIQPGETISGFGMSRPELPGVARMRLQGRVPEPWVLDSLPETDFWKAKVKEIEDQDFVLAAVLAPVIAVPEPYSGAELARRIQSHMNTWVKYGHANQATIDALNQQFQLLIPALEQNNKRMVRQTAIELLTKTFGEHRGMHLGHCLQDEDRFMGHKHSKVRTKDPKEAGLDRIAARSLAFNVFYLLVRMEMGR